MRSHIDLGNNDFERLRMLSTLIADGEISIGGNRLLKIYGKLSCTSGKRLKIQNRVFFKNEEEAIKHGYRPCGHCMREEYKIWKLIAYTRL